MNQTIFDHGASQQLGSVLVQHGIRRPLLCTDQGLVSLGMVSQLTDKLSNEAAVTIFDKTPENPTQTAVAQRVLLGHQRRGRGLQMQGCPTVLTQALPA